jgi:cytidylate kinase
VIIAIDGPAASGKGTLARRIAAHFGLRRLDTGLLYRAVAKAVLDSGGDVNDPGQRRRAAKALNACALTDEAALRLPGVGEAASIVAADPQVRGEILAFQRAFASTTPGAVLDGRDIGTVVCPDADAKLFVTASAEARAERRWKELAANGTDETYEQVLADIRRRDARDSSRAVAPLKPADDAHLLDTTDLDIEAAFRAAVDLISGS